VLNIWRELRRGCLQLHCWEGRGRYRPLPRFPRRRQARRGRRSHARGFRRGEDRVMTPPRDPAVRHLHHQSWRRRRTAFLLTSCAGRYLHV